MWAGLGTVVACVAVYIIFTSASSMDTIRTGLGAAGPEVESSTSPNSPTQHTTVSMPPPGFDARTQLQFDGDRITVRMPPAEFLALPYAERAQIISRQISAVVDYVSARTGMSDIVNIVCRLDNPAPGVIQIRNDFDPACEDILKLNYSFSTNVRTSAVQERFIHTMISSLSADTSGHLDENEYIQKMHGFSDTGFMRRFLSDEAVQYIELAMTVRDIARAAIGGRNRSSREKIEALMDWVFVNVSNHFVRQAPGFEDFADYNDRPLGYMLRGMGDCDRSAWVLCRLADRAGMSAHVVYLHKPGEENRASWHTVTEIRTDRGWQAVDPFNNIIYDKSVLQLSREGDYFKRSWIFPNHVPPLAYLPVMKIADMICRSYIADLELFVDVKKTVYAYLSDEYGETTNPGKADQYVGLMSRSYAVQMMPDEVSLTRWEMPFWIRGYYYEGAFRTYKRKKLPFMAKIREARLEQILGHYDQAGKLFESLKNDTGESDPRFAEERDYFMILNAYYEQDYASVERDVPLYREKYPETPRNTMLRYLLAHSLKTTGDLLNARAIYPAEANFQGRGKID